MNHKRYPLAYLLEVVMPLNLTIIRDEEPISVTRTEGAKSDWVIEFSAGQGKTVIVNYFHRRKEPFEIQCMGFNKYPYYLRTGQQLFMNNRMNLWEAIQMLRVLDMSVNTIFLTDVIERKPSYCETKV